MRKRSIVLGVLVAAITASPSKAERAPVTCEQFIASINDGGKNYDAPPLTIEKTLAYGDFKDSQLTMFPDVEVMPETSEAMAAVRAGLTMAIAMHAFGLDWKTALNMRDQMVREMSTESGRAETNVEGATIRLHRGMTGIPVFQIEYPDPVN